VKLSDVPTPALLLDLDVLEANVERMARRARELGVRLRPHVKTHKCVEIGRRQREAGAEGITVSTLPEARAFAEAGFRDLTWAFPVVPSRIPGALEIGREARLGLVVDSREALEAVERSGGEFPVWIAVDAGYGREGLPPDHPELVELARALEGSATLEPAGLLSHSGQAYAGRSPGELARAAEEERAAMVAAADRLRDAGHPPPALSVGSTPAMSRARSLEGVDEARPGNYVFHDRTQVALGSCGLEDVALTVAATVVSRRPDLGQSVVDAGALALSQDPGPQGEPFSMGEIFADHGEGRLREDARVVSLSQEHGVVDHPLPWGERVRILPNHSCLTAACFDEYHVVRGDRVVDRWAVHRKR
jgi:D-serine deaminase-like pyridoxal phosphate-dependent protein